MSILKLKLTGDRGVEGKSMLNKDMVILLGRLSEA